MDQLVPLKEIRDITYDTLQKLKIMASGCSATVLVEYTYIKVVKQIDSIVNGSTEGRKNLWERNATKLRKA